MTVAVIPGEEELGPPGIGDTDRLGSGYRWRRLGLRQTRACATAHAAGVSAAALAREYGVSRRTIYRALGRALQPIVTVEVADWHADFAITDAGPVRMTEWHANT